MLLHQYTLQYKLLLQRFLLLHQCILQYKLLHRQTTSPTVLLLHQHTLQYKLLHQRFSLVYISIHCNTNYFTNGFHCYLSIHCNSNYFTNGCLVTSVYTAIQTTSPTGFCCYISIHKALLTVKAVDISTPCTTHYVTEVTAP